MNPYMAYDAASTKIAARQGYLLRGDDWDRIFECTTVAQVIEYLKDKPVMQRIMNEISTGNLHRDDLEAVLYKYRTIDIENILHYFSGPYKDFMETVLMEYEIEDLCLILRKISRDEDMHGIEKRFVHSDVYTRLSYEKLLSSESVAGFTESLRGSVYYNSLKTLTDEDAVKREFHIEMKLHVLLYKMLIAKANRLGKADEAAVRDIMGTRVDFANVQWIYRAVKYYDISPEEILIYSLSGGKRINYLRLKDLCYSKSEDEFKIKSADYLGVNIFKSSDESGIDAAVNYCIYQYLKKHKYDGTIGVFLAYIYKLNIVIDDLTSVTEGIKYNLTKDELKKYLIHTM